MQGQRVNINRKIRLLALIAIQVLVCYQLNAQQLYVGTNYHPHDDKNIEKWKSDIALMKAAGFKVVRMGHLAWDSYEPAEGKFDFKWFDTVMDLMNRAGIKVILDIAVRPAPIWLHHKFPSIDVTNSGGERLYPNHRYMDDIGDPDYQNYAAIYADSLTKHYAHHPALLAFGIDNESGDGPISYSEAARKRFVTWLRKKYTTLDSLNSAWASQRWSRKINDFDEVGLPLSGDISGPPERVLDFRRFESDEINAFLLSIIHIVNVNAPNAFTNTNAWYYSPQRYFDYSEIAYSGKMTREGCGFYPGNSLKNNWGLVDACLGISRIQFESSNPFWCSEFTTHNAVPNSIRKSAYASLMYGNQMVCGWTWQSMQGGEEQYLEGMMDWDGVVNRKYYEYKTIAEEFKKIEKYFPYKVNADVALAFSFPSEIASTGFPMDHDAQLRRCFDLFFDRNMDIRIVEISKSKLLYKLLIVPGVTVMDKLTANKIRDYVYNGGTVIMTANSALVNETGQVFASTHPGLLADVFGIRVAGYEHTADFNEISRKNFKDNNMEVTFKKNRVTLQSSWFDVIEPKGAAVMGTITSLDKPYPVVTTNKYGKGNAIYIGLPADRQLLDPLIDQLTTDLSLKKGPDVPAGVMARAIDKKHVLYLNISDKPQVIIQKQPSTGILSGKNYSGSFSIDPFQPEFIELK